MSSAPNRQRRAASLAKLSRPRLAEVYVRERLFTALDEARSHPVIFISSPPGAGKTTLISGYLDARELHAVWYQIDEGDQDIATFFYYLGLAGKQANPRKRRALPLFTFEYARGIPTFSRNFFTELFERLPRPAVVVFDNYQEAAAQCGLQEVMRAGLEVVPQDCNVFIASRHAPPAAFARMQANGQVAALAWHQLQLTECEAQGVVALRQHQIGIVPPATAWIERTQGWMAGLILLLEWLQSEEVEPEALTNFAPETMFNYFAAELLSKVDSCTRDFLVKSALLPKMTEATAAALTGNERAAAILAELDRKSFFITRHTNARQSYQYHPLFREFLLAQANAAFPEEDINRLKCEAATLLEEDGQLEAAIRLHSESRNWARTTGLIKTNAQAMLTQGRAQTLAEWIAALPEDMRASDPWLLYWMGNCLMGLDPHRSLLYFEQAFDQFRSAKHVVGVYFAWCGAVESIRYDWGGSYKRWDHWVQVLDQVIDEQGGFPTPDIELKVAQAIQTPMARLPPSHPKRLQWWRRMVAFPATQGDLSMRVDTLGRMLLTQLCEGDHMNARTVLEELERLLTSGDPSPLAHTGALTWIALYRLGAGQLDECRNRANKGLDIATRTGSHFYDFHLMYYAGVASIIAGDLKIASELMGRMAAMPESRADFGAYFYHHLAACYFLHQQDYPRARTHTQACIATAQEGGFPFLEAWGRDVHALVCLEAGDADGGSEQLVIAMRIIQDIGSRWLQWGNLCVQAYGALRGSDESVALIRLREALIFSRTQGFKVLPGVPSKVYAALCGKALEANIEVEYAREFIQTLKLIPDGPSWEIEAWPWELRIYTLGRFEAMRDDKPLAFSRKAPKQVLRLLKTLVALGGRQVREHQLIDALWPDEGGEAGHSAFTTTLHRLRMLVGDKMIVMSEAQVTLDPRRCWTDTWTFDHVLAQAERKVKEHNQDEWVRLTEQALELYKGDFLADEPDVPCSGTLRRRLRTRFVSQTSELARHFEEAGQWENALRSYQRGLECDDLAEVFYQGLIRTYAQLGFRAEALEIYHRCKRHLSISLGARPSSATEQAYQATLRG